MPRCRSGSLGRALACSFLCTLFLSAGAQFLSVHTPSAEPVIMALTGGMCGTPLTTKQGDVSVIPVRNSEDYFFTRIIALDGESDSYLNMNNGIVVGCRTVPAESVGEPCLTPTALTVHARALVSERRRWARIFEISSGPYTQAYVFGQQEDTGRLAFVSRNPAFSTDHVLIASSDPLPMDIFLDVQLVLEHRRYEPWGLDVAIYVEQELVASGSAHPIAHTVRSHNTIGKSSYGGDQTWKGGIGNLAFFEKSIEAVDRLADIDHPALWSIADVPNWQPIWRGNVALATSVALPGALGFQRRVADFRGGYIDLGPDLGHTPQNEGSWSAPAHFIDGSVSFSAYVFLRSASSWARIVELGNGPTDKGLINLGFYDDSGKLTVEVQDSFLFSPSTAVRRLVAPNRLPLDRWVHVAATLQGYQSTFVVGADNGGNYALARLYQDGVQVSSGEVFRPFGIPRSMNYLGRSSVAASEPLDGLMASFELYDVAICPEHVRHLANAAATSSLVDRVFVPEPLYTLQFCQRASAPPTEVKSEPICSTVHDAYPRTTKPDTTSAVHTSTQQPLELTTTSQSPTTTPAGEPEPEDPCVALGLNAPRPAGWRQVGGEVLDECECAIPGQEGDPISNCGCPDVAYWDSLAGTCVCYNEHQLYLEGERVCMCPEPMCTDSMQRECAPVATCQLDSSTYWCECPDGFVGDGRGPLGCQPAPPTSSSPTPLPATSPTVALPPQATSAPRSTPEPADDPPTPPPGPPTILEGPDQSECVPVLAAARGCDLWVRDTLELRSGDVEGKVCVGGDLLARSDLSLSSHIPGVAAGSCPLFGPFQYTLVVGGDLRWDSGRRYRGAYCVGGEVLDRPDVGPLDTPVCTSDRDSGCGDVIDFESDYEQLLAVSDSLWAGTPPMHRSVAAIKQGQITCSLNASFARHLVELDAALFEGWEAWGLRTLVLDGAAESIELVVVNLVNVQPGGLEISRVMNIQTGLRQKVLFNYPGQFAVRIKTPVYASMLMPRASLARDSSSFVQGQVVVRTYLTSEPASINVLHSPMEVNVLVCEQGGGAETELLLAKEAEALALSNALQGTEKAGDSGRQLSTQSWLVGLAGLLVGLLLGVGASRLLGSTPAAVSKAEAGKMLFTNLHGQAPRVSGDGEDVRADIRFQRTGSADCEQGRGGLMRTVSGAMQRVRKVSKKLSVMSLTTPRSAHSHQASFKFKQFKDEVEMGVADDSEREPGR